MAKFVAETLILIKAESVYGVDALPTATDALLVSDLSFPEMQGEIVDRNLVRPFMGGSPQAVVSERMGFSFTCEAAGSGTAGTAPRFGAGLQACRNTLSTVASTSNTFAPFTIFGANSSATIYHWIGGIRHIITGWRGSHSLNLNNNNFGANRFEGMGIYQGPTDTALGTYTYPVTNPLPVTLGNTLNINIAGFTTAFLESFAFTQQHQMSFNSLPGGVKEVLITQAQQSTFEVTIECPTIAQRNFFADALTQTTGALSITQGTTAGNRQAFSAPAAKTLLPRYSDSNGKLMLTVPGIILPVSGNDEYSHVFS